jgi:outer membrane receptor protein involved in Fe transport
LILVDGKERDKNFLSQIIPDHIEKVEIMSAPPAGYDGDVTGVINIVLKKEKKSGVSGQINLEIPALSSIYYIHPDYTLSFAYKNLSFFTSYNGELIRFDQQESIFRRIKTGYISLETKSDQYVVQKLWSHNFHYGIDYSLNQKNRLSFYGYFNPYSQEYDGLAKAGTEMNGGEQWEASRSTTDINRSVFYSFYFKHIFNERGGELTLETGTYQLKGENMATYKTISNESAEIKNSNKPFQKSLSLKVDLSVPFGNNLALSAGVRIRGYRMQDRSFDDFKYSGEVYSAYATVGQTVSNFDWKLGLRMERSVSDLKEIFHKHYLSVLPSASMSYKISTDKALKFAVSNAVNRANIYQLNPNSSMDDPYSIRQGNPSLNPEFRTAVSLEYSRKFKSNFATVRLFYNRTGNAINSVTFLNDTSLFESITGNFGTIHQSGFQFSGTFKIGRLITFIPYLRLYAQFTDVNRLAESS